jgi:hypothetical protein
MFTVYSIFMEMFIPCSSSSSRGSRASSVSHADLTVLVAVLLLFAAFFLAMFTQYRAEVTFVYSAINRDVKMQSIFRSHCSAHSPGSGRLTGIGASATLMVMPMAEEPETCQREWRWMKATK